MILCDFLNFPNKKNNQNADPLRMDSKFEDKNKYKKTISLTFRLTLIIQRNNTDINDLRLRHSHIGLP